MKNEILAVILALIVVGSLGVGYFAGGQLNVRTTTSTSTVLTTATITTTITSGTTYGTFHYAPKGPLQVDSVWATGTPGRSGIENVSFYVTFENVGASPIYATGGYGISSLSSSVSGNSTVLREAHAIQCPGAIFLLVAILVSHIILKFDDNLSKLHFCMTAQIVPNSNGLTYRNR